MKTKLIAFSIFSVLSLAGKIQASENHTKTTLSYESGRLVAKNKSGRWTFGFGYARQNDRSLTEVVGIPGKEVARQDPLGRGDAPQYNVYPTGYIGLGAGAGFGTYQGLKMALGRPGSFRSPCRMAAAAGGFALAAMTVSAFANAHVDLRVKAAKKDARPLDKD